MDTDDQRTIMILGAGINGAATARELLLNGVSVVLVDAGDIASGTTAYSSRLIHGGLRYLEFGEFSLVRESLEERGRMLRLAPQFVRPLRFHIPIRNRWGGAWSAIRRFLGIPAVAKQSRGLWLVRLGLTLYDRFARDDGLPASTSSSLNRETHPRLNSQSFRWFCSYSDAQVRYPERFVAALLEDARQIAQENGLRFELLTYHRAELRDGVVRITDREGSEARQCRPAAVVNATGAWVDRVLAGWQVPSRRLTGGTKGAHLIVDHQALAEHLNGDAIYVEAADGRPVFLLPFGETTLIGTTDLPFDGDPGTAVASDAEIAYLLAAANEVFSDVELTTADIQLHYAGVRPLPYRSTARSTSAITRRHSIEEHRSSSIPIYSIIGGKLTTCRALAEEVCQVVLDQFGLASREVSRDRPLPGGRNFPPDEATLAAELQQIADATGLNLEQVAAAWRLFGTRTNEMLSQTSELESIAGTAIPVRLVREVIRREWVSCLSDLVERRLMLLYDRGLSYATLMELVELLSAEGKMTSGIPADEVAAYQERLLIKFGKVI